jgi:SAM-dependent methyltransferase
MDNNILTPQVDIELSKEKWESFYGVNHKSDYRRYPSEWVVRTLAGGDYPDLKIDKSLYKDSNILDMGCGDGRNLQLLLDLRFKVYATEISSAIVQGLEDLARQCNWSVSFKVGRNVDLPYPINFFDYMLCSSSCYYMDGLTTWSEVRSELARVIKPGGLFIANFPDEGNAVLRNAIRQSDGSLKIINDPFNLRNGSRFLAVQGFEDVKQALAPQFNVISIGHQNDDYYGLSVSGYFFVAKRI